MPMACSGGGTRLQCLLPLFFAAGACASHFPPCPASAGPPWRELSSDHFRLRTDLQRDDARATLRELEDLRAALLRCFRAPVDLPTGRVPVIAVERGWSDFARYRSEGFFTRTLFQPLIVLRAGDSVSRQETIKHELVHYLSQRVIPVQPLWFAEGLASYFMTIEYDPDVHRITVGRPPESLLQVVRRGGLSDAEEMMAATSVPPDDRGFFYATAWFMVHYLMNHQANALAAYSRALSRLPARAAWAGSFRGLTADALDTAMNVYRDGGEYALLLYPFDPPTTRITEERMLTDADVHATRALLFALASRDGGAMLDEAGSRELAKIRAHQEIHEVFQQEPSHLQAQAIEHWVLGAPTRLDEARAVAKRNPTHWMAWALLAEALREHQVEEGQAQAVSQALDLAEEDPAVELRKLTIHRPLSQP